MPLETMPPGLLPIDDDPVVASRFLTALAPLASPDDTPLGAAEIAALDESDATTPATLEPVPAVDLDGNWCAEAAPELGGALEVGPAMGLSAPAADSEIDALQILRDRPDVYAAFYREFYGPNNDRSSPAWTDRVGGETAEDYARYWYSAHGRFEGYAPGSNHQGAPLEGATEAPEGRTTVDGVPLSKILADRPDVFQAFFTEYYGPGNDRHSDAWDERVGGATVEDFANYWYNAHGRMEGYAPSWPAPNPAHDPDGAPDPEPPQALEPLRVEDPSLDPWNHPAIYPDWQPPYPGWRPPTADGSSDPSDPASAPSLAEDGVVEPHADLTAGRSLFDDAVF